jgi:glycine cleavage system aminomethyltransferase T
MTTQQHSAISTLEDKIRHIGSPVRMLRDAPVGAYPFPIRSEYTNWRDEQEAWRKGLVLMDQSFHMTDFYFKGPDVHRLLSDVAVNSFATFGKDKAKQLVGCNPDGYVIADAILFGLNDDEVSIVGRAALPNWVAYHAETGGYDVSITRDLQTSLNGRERLIFRYQLQGPDALSVIHKAHGGPIAHIKFFNIGSFIIAGCPVRALNHTMSGVPGQELTGLEMWGPVEHRERVLEALLQAGEEFGLQQVGARAYPTMAIESGWIPSPTPAIYSGEELRPYREWLSASSWEASASLGGSFVSDDIEDYYQTPWDMGLDRLVKFDHDFIGREALERAADQPHRRKVWLRWNDEDATLVYASSLFGREDRAKYMDLPVANYSTLSFDQVLVDGELVGLSTTTGYSANVRGWLSLAMVDEERAVDGAQVTVVWGEEGGGSRKPTVERHVQSEVRATVHTKPLI